MVSLKCPLLKSKSSIIIEVTTTMYMILELCNTTVWSLYKNKNTCYICVHFRQKHYITLGSALKCINHFPTLQSQIDRFSKLVSLFNKIWTDLSVKHHLCNIECSWIRIDYLSKSYLEKYRFSLEKSLRTSRILVWKFCMNHVCYFTHSCRVGETFRPWIWTSSTTKS